MTNINLCTTFMIMRSTLLPYTFSNSKEIILLRYTMQSFRAIKIAELAYMKHHYYTIVHGQNVFAEYYVIRTYG